jgi:hypothetical protein
VEIRDDDDVVDPLIEEVVDALADVVLLERNEAFPSTSIRSRTPRIRLRGMSGSGCLCVLT